MDITSIKPALLTRTEAEFLLGKKIVTPDHARKIRFDINRKLRILRWVEIPLLESAGYNVTTGSNAITTGSNTASDQLAKTAQSEGGVNRETKALGGIRTLDLRFIIVGTVNHLSRR